MAGICTGRSMGDEVEGTTTHTVADSSKERVVHTYTAFLAERKLVSKAAPPVANMSFSKMQRRLLSPDNSYFK